MSGSFESKVQLAAEKLNFNVETLELPPLPSVYNQLGALLSREDCSFEKVAEIIQNDPAVTMKILKAVNSSAFGFNTEISQIPAAVRILGFNQLSHLILGLSILKLSDNVIEAEFNYKQFWEHSLAVGVGARVLIKYSNSPVHLELKDAFICGLLHDIGKIIENQYFNREFRQAVSLCKKKKINLIILKNKTKINKNIQSKARDVRYKLLLNFCNKNKIKFILTGHQRDDQIETFLIRLSRGSGVQGLSSMKKSSNLNKKIKLIRPLLDFKKKDLTILAKKYFGKVFKIQVILIKSI